MDVVTKASPPSVAAGTPQKSIWIVGHGFAPGVTVAISGDGISPLSAPVVVLEADRRDGGRGDGITYSIGVDGAATLGHRDITVTGPDGSTATGAGILEIAAGSGVPPTAPPTAPPTEPPSGGVADGGVAPVADANLPPASGHVDIVTKASPLSGAQGEQINLWVVGRTFQDGVQVSFSGANMTPALVDNQPLPLKVSRNVPSEGGKLDGIEYYLRIGQDTPLGPVSITVTGPDGSSATGANIFTVLAPGQVLPPQPGAGQADTITGASPPAFHAGRNVSLWIWGGDYDDGATVTFSQPGIHNYSPFEVVDHAANYPGFDGVRAFLLVDANVPAGPVDVTVSNLNGSQVTSRGLIQVVGGDGGAGAGGSGGTGTVDPCLPETTSIEDISDVHPAEALRDAPLPLTIVGHGFACGAKVAISGGGLSAPAGSTPHILRDAADPTLTTLRWDLQVGADARFGPRDVTVVNPNNTSKTVTGAFEIVEELSPDGGVGEKSKSIKACQAAPGTRGGPVGVFFLALPLWARRRRR